MRLACIYGTTYPSSGGIFSVSSFSIFTQLRACMRVSVTRPRCLLMVLVHPLVGSAELITTHFSWDQPRLVEPWARSYPLGFLSTNEQHDRRQAYGLALLRPYALRLPSRNAATGSRVFLMEAWPSELPLTVEEPLEREQRCTTGCSLMDGCAVACFRISACVT